MEDNAGTQRSLRIDEELVCMDALKYALETKGKATVGLPKRSRPGSDPPDFWVEVNGREMAVEVCSITEFQTYESHCRQLARCIEMKARNSDVLRGTYLLIIRRRPQIPKLNRKRLSEPYCIAHQYINDNREVEVADEVVLFQDDNGEIQLKKIHVRNAPIGLIHVTVEFEGQTIEKLAELIDSACRSKTDKLLKKNCPPSEAILALYDAYGFADSQTVKSAVALLDTRYNFHSVFWAASFSPRENILYPKEHGRGGAFLWSTVSEWLDGD